MTLFLFIIGSAYVLALAYAAVRARAINSGDEDEIILARRGVPVSLLFLSFSATLFSTFTLMGIPDFFRTHGLATWLFIGVTDVAMGFVVLWFGLKYRHFLSREGVRGISSVLKLQYGRRFVVWVYILGIFVFLAPYVAIQIQGVSQLATALAPADIPPEAWSVMMLVLILFYSWVGGFRAIVYSDVAQGIILLTVIWVVGATLTSGAGGVQALFEGVRATSPSLLSAPGPNGLMTGQFLIASFLAIMWMPITQPQLTTRIAASESVRDIPVMALGISVFALVILLPTILIGMAGAYLYPNLSTGDFLAQVLIHEQAAIVGALALVGLLAAAMSTADSQLFALGSESQLAMAKDENKLSEHSMRAVIVAFTVVCFVLSLLSSTELVSLARVSFAGTAMVGPMIVLAVVSTERLSLVSPALAFGSLLVFLFSSVGYLPNEVEGIRIDLALMIGTAAAALLEFGVSRLRQR